MKKAPAPFVAIFLAANVFNATLFPPPDVPTYKNMRISENRRSDEIIYINRSICINISTNKNTFIMRNIGC